MKKLHSKQVGALGVLAIAADLAAQDYFVFTELGDLSKTDLIVMGAEYDPIKVQVKTVKSVNGKITISPKKSGPGYRFRYAKHHADIYAVFVRNLKLCLYVSNTELLRQKSTLTIRTVAAKNGQISGVRLAVTYRSFERALRDCTRCTLPRTRG